MHASRCSREACELNVIQVGFEGRESRAALERGVVKVVRLEARWTPEGWGAEPVSCLQDEAGEEGF